MTTAPLSRAGAERVFYTLSLTRWLPIGLVVGMMTLLQAYFYPFTHMVPIPQP